MTIGRLFPRLTCSAYLYIWMLVQIVLFPYIHFISYYNGVVSGALRRSDWRGDSRTAAQRRPCPISIYKLVIDIARRVRIFPQKHLFTFTLASTKTAQISPVPDDRLEMEAIITRG